MKAVIICGPTATGKTNLALQLAKYYPFEIVSADSRQAYKHLDIVTGKDYPLDGTKIQGYDLFDTNEKINISDYREKVIKLIKLIYKKNKIPLIVGGAGYYIDAIVNPPETINVAPNEKLRKELENLSAQDLYNKLLKINKNLALSLNKSDKNNPVRLIRKLELELSDQNTVKNKKTFDDVLWIGLTADFEFIKSRIRDRVIKRAKLIEDEIEYLEKNNLYTDIVKNIIGYKSWGKDNAVEEWTKDEINYAKRQLTWFKKNKKINWFDIQKEPNYQKKVEELINSWHNKINSHA